MIGFFSKLYRNTGSSGSPTWTVVPIVADLVVTPQYDEAEGPTRESRLKGVAKTMLDIQVSGKLRVKPGDAGYEAFRDAALDDTELDLLILTGPKDEEGSEGFRASWLVFPGANDQGNGNVLFSDFTLKLPIGGGTAKFAVVDDTPALVYTTPWDD